MTYEEKLTPLTVTAEVQRVREISLGDPEAAHAIEDKIYRDVMYWIASNPRHPWVADMAAAVTELASIEYPRWCA